VRINPKDLKKKTYGEGDKLEREGGVTGKIVERRDCPGSRSVVRGGEKGFLVEEDRRLKGGK